MIRSRRRRNPPALFRRWSRDISQGRFERSLSAFTAAGAAVTGAEIYFEHYKGGFADPWMWTPVALAPPVVLAGVGGVFSRKSARTWLPLTAGLFALNGFLGEYLHLRGVARRPGGWSLATYNAVMGPPPAAPVLMSIVGAMGLVAAILRREGE